MIKAIIFDYDGVIIDSFQGVFATYQKICQRFQVACPPTLDDFRKIYGYDYRECLNNLGIHEKSFREISEIYKNEISQIKHDLFPGITKVLQKLNKDYQLYLVSASFSQEIIPRLKKHHLHYLFQEIYCGGDQNIRKKMIIKNILIANNYAVNEVISVGDRAVDYDVARSLGLDDNHVILVTYGWGLDENRIGQSHIAHHPAEILNFINQ